MISCEKHLFNMNYGYKRTYYMKTTYKNTDKTLLALNGSS